jgi:two-component system sensor histidine kinase YesM
MLKPWKLKPFLVIILVSFVGFFLSLTILPVYFGVHNIITEQTSKSYLDLVHNNHQHITERLRKIEETSLSVSTDSLIRRGLENFPTNSIYESIVESRVMNEWINNILYIQPYITSIQVYAYGNIPKVWGTERIQSVSSIPWTEYMELFQEVDSIWLPARQDSFTSSEEVVLTHAMEVFNRKGETSGYVEVNLDAKALWGLIEGRSTESVSSNRISVLFDRKGKLMTLNSFEKSLKEHVDPSLWLPGIKQLDREDFHLQSIEGEEYLFVNTPKSSYDWRLVEIIPVKEVYSNVNSLRKFMIIVSICTVLLAFPVATYISNRFIKPVDQLLQGFKRIETVNFGSRMPKHFIEEFYQLSLGYNKMVKQIQILLNQVEAEHRSKRDAELRALQSQINPHFLYNTLDMINWTAAMEGNKKVSKMASLLAKLFRISLSKTGPLIKLREELEHGRVYAQIQQARFSDKFEYVDHIPQEFRFYYVPRIILQPFIENAIIHGFNEVDHENEEKAQVIVSTEAVDSDHYKLIIEDNGQGLKKNVTALSKHKKSMYLSGSSGYGIDNVSQRIKFYFGERYGVKLMERKPTGVRVEIILPIIRDLQQIEYQREE